MDSVNRNRRQTLKNENRNWPAGVAVSDLFINMSVHGCGGQGTEEGKLEGCK